MRIRAKGDWRGEGVFCIGPGHFKRSPYSLLQRLILAGWRNKANFRNTDDDIGMDVSLKLELSSLESEKRKNSRTSSTAGRKEEELDDDEFIEMMERKMRFYGKPLSAEEAERYGRLMESKSPDIIVG